jgi:hypothetical protein
MSFFSSFSKGEAFPDPTLAADCGGKRAETRLCREDLRQQVFEINAGFRVFHFVRRFFLHLLGLLFRFLRAPALL